MLDRIRIWLDNNIDVFCLWVGLFFCLLATALLVEPMHLYLNGASADGVVTEAGERRNSPPVHPNQWTRGYGSATIRFNAEGQDREIHANWTRDRAAHCFAGCYSKGQRLKVRYLKGNPGNARVETWNGMFGLPILFGLIAVIAFFTRWGMRILRDWDSPSGATK